MPQHVVRSPQDLGRAISEIRHQEGLTQQELADLTGIDRTYLSRLENATSSMTLERAIRALRRMGAEVVVRSGGTGG